MAYGIVGRDMVTHLIISSLSTSKKAPEIAANIHERFTLECGGIIQLHTDNGGELVNDIDDINCELFKISHTTIKPRCPQENGGAESAVKQWKSQMILLQQEYANRNNITFNKKKWLSIWPEMNAMATYNCNVIPSSTTGIIPFEYAFNKKIRGIGDSESSSTTSITSINEKNCELNKISTNNLLNYHENTYKNIDDLGRKTATRKRKQYKQYYDNKYETSQRLEVGSYVKYFERGHWLPLLSFLFFFYFFFFKKICIYKNIYILKKKKKYNKTEEELYI